MHNILLNNGVEMPMIGMGTWPLNGLKLAWLVRKAAQVGYRAFDTASAYVNEKWLGRGIRFCGIPRAELFVTSKLSNTEQRQGDVRASFQGNLKRLGLEYLDLYLMHWPNPGTYLDSWQQMAALYKNGLVGAIGVCNFHQHHLEALVDVSDVIPAINQIELHPMLPQVELRDFCKRQGIQVEAYSPLARMHETLIGNSVMVSLAGKYGKSVPQVILRWDFQHGIISIPKSSSRVRLQSNADIFDFDLDDCEMDAVDSLGINLRVRYDPDNCDFSKL